MPLVQKHITSAPSTPELIPNSIKHVKVSKKPNKPKNGGKTKKRKSIIQKDVIPEITPDEKLAVKSIRKWKRLKDVKLEKATVDKPNDKPDIKPKRKWKVKKDLKPEVTSTTKPNDEQNEKLEGVTKAPELVKDYKFTKLYT